MGAPHSIAVWYSRTVTCFFCFSVCSCFDPTHHYSFFIRNLEGSHRISDRAISRSLSHFFSLVSLSLFSLTQLAVSFIILTLLFFSVFIVKAAAASLASFVHIYLVAYILPAYPVPLYDFTQHPYHQSYRKILLFLDYKTRRSSPDSRCVALVYRIRYGKKRVPKLKQEKNKECMGCGNK